MTAVTETFTGPTGAPTGGAVTFTPCTMRRTTDNDAVLVPCTVRYPIDPDTGVFTTGDIEPGCYVVVVALDCHKCPDPKTYTINVPLTGDYTLWELVNAYIPLPPDIGPYVVSVGGLSGIITQQQIADMVGAVAAGSYVHTQNAPSAVWTITHSLGQQIVDATTVFSLDYTIQYDNVIVECLSPTQCNLYFADPVSGVALIQR